MSSCRSMAAISIACSKVFTGRSRIAAVRLCGGIVLFDLLLDSRRHLPGRLAVEHGQEDQNCRNRQADRISDHDGFKGRRLGENGIDPCNSCAAYSDGGQNGRQKRNAEALSPDCWLRWLPLQQFYLHWRNCRLQPGQLH